MLADRLANAFREGVTLDVQEERAAIETADAGQLAALADDLLERPPFVIVAPKSVRAALQWDGAAVEDAF
jgi:hypothetical protein